MYFILLNVVMKQMNLWVMERQLKHADVRLKFELGFVTRDAAICTDASSW